MSYKPSSKVHNTVVDYEVPTYVDVVVVEAADKTITLPDPTTCGGRAIMIIADNSNITINSVGILGAVDTISNSTGYYISDVTDWHKFTLPTGGEASISDTAYSADTWDGVTTIAPSKNAVRDKFFSIDSVITGKQDALTNGFGITGTTTKAVSLTTANASAAANVSMATANTWYTGAEVSLAAGTWLIIGTITLNRTATTAQQYQARLYNTTDAAAYASTQEYQASVANAPISLCLNTVVTLAGTKTIAIQATSSVSTNNTILAATLANGQGNNATQISAIRIA